MSISKPVHGSTGSANNNIQPKRQIAPGEQTQPTTQTLDYDNLDHLRVALERHPLENVAFNFIWNTNSPEVVRQVAEAVKTRDGHVDSMAPQDNKFTLLHLLVERKTTPPSPELIQVLMDMGADPNKKNTHGLTVFDRLDSSSRPPAVAKQIETILTKGGTLKAERFSPFKWAVHQIGSYFYPSDRTIKATQQPSVPIQNGSISTEPLPINTLPPVITVKTPTKQPLKLELNKPLRQEADNLALIEYALANPNGSFAIPLLASAVIPHTNTPEVVELIAQNLVTKHRDIDFPIFAANLSTMLHNLVGRGKPELIEILIRMGANPHTKNANGETAFDWIPKIKAETPAQTKELQDHIRAILNSTPKNKPQTQAKAVSQNQPQIPELAPINPLSTLKNYVSQKMASAYAELPEAPSFSDLTPPILMNAFVNSLTTHNPLMAGLPQTQPGSALKRPEPEYTETGVETDPLPEDPRIQQQAEELVGLRTQTTQLSAQAKKLEEKLAKSQTSLKETQTAQERQQVDSAAEKATLTEQNRQLREELTKFKKTAAKDQKQLETAIESAKAQNKTIEAELQKKTKSSLQLETEKQSLHDQLTKAERTLQTTQAEQEKALEQSKRQQQQQASHLGRLKQENAKLREELQTEKARQTEAMAQLRQELEATRKEHRELQAELSKTKTSMVTHLIDRAQAQQAQSTAHTLREELEKTKTEQHQAAQQIEALTQAQEKATQELQEAQTAIETLRQAQQEAVQHSQQSAHRAYALQMELMATRQAAAQELQEAHQAYADMMLQWQQAWASADQGTLIQAQAANGVIISLGDQLEKALKALGISEEKFPLLAEVDPQAGLPEAPQTEQAGQPRWFVPFPQTGQPIEELHPSYIPVQGPFGLGTMYMTGQEIPRLESNGISNELAPPVGELTIETNAAVSDTREEAEPESPVSATSQTSNPQVASYRKTKEAPGRLESTAQPDEYDPPMLNAERRSQSMKLFTIPQD